MKATTVKRLAILIAVLSLLGGSSFIAHGFQVDRLGKREIKKAESAIDKGDFAEAKIGFWRYLQVFPDDLEIQIKYADALLKESKSLKAQSDALQIYNNILKQPAGREDVRRKRMQLKIDMQRFSSSSGRENGADVDLETLLKSSSLDPKLSSPDDKLQFQNLLSSPDGYLQFLLGQCYEDKAGDDLKTLQKAKEMYEAAIKHNVPLGCGLQLMSSVNDITGIPTEGKNLTIVAVVDQVLYFSMFDNDGKKVVNTDEKKLTKQARQIEDLRKQLESLWRPHELTRSEKDQVITNVAAIVGHTPDHQVKASERLATLLRVKLKKPDEAKKVIDALVKTSPNDYRAYLARGRYHLVLAVSDPSQTSHLSDAKKDFEEAKGRATSEPDIYLALAEAAVNGSKPNYDEARQHLKAGLEIAPTSTALYQALANTERYAGSMDEAIKVLENGLEVQPDHFGLRRQLTELLIQRGDTGKLHQQIEELKRRGYSPILIQLFTACYYINSNEFVKARQLLVTLRAATGRITDVKFQADINVLLARCHKELGEPEMQQNAYRKALGANPEDLTARLGWIDTLISHGDIAGAIKEYRDLAKQFPKKFPQVRLALARLLIDYNQRRPKPQRDWNEVKELIKQLSEGSPEALEPTIILNAQFLFAQGDQAAAISEIEKARSQFPKSVEIWTTQAKFVKLQGRVDDALALLVQAQQQFPKSVEIWTTQADLMGLQGQVDDALALLDKAQQQLGDLVDLRLERARLLASRKGEQTLKNLMDLSEHVKNFSKPDRKRFLNELAIELHRRQDLEGARGLWTQLAEEYPSNIDLRLKLLDLALQNVNKDEKDEKDNKDKIEKNIKQIEKIEGNEGVQGRFSRVRYLIWQAERVEDKDKMEAIQREARLLLDDLRLRRSDWSVIPLASAELAELELAQRGCDLRLLSSVKGVSDIPTEGKNLVIVAVVDQVLHFRTFDSDGKYVDTDDKRLTEQARQIEGLRKQLESWWPRHKLTWSEKGWIITTVTSIVGHTPQGNLSGDEKRAKEESIIGFYEQAINLGRHDPDLVYRTIQLLFKNGRGSRAFELLKSIPEESQLGSQLDRQVGIALARRDFQLAEQLVLKAIEANPDDFQARFSLAQIIQASGDQVRAGKELRKAVDRSPSDPKRWSTLISFMIDTKQLAEAEKAIGDAEAILPPLETLALQVKTHRIRKQTDRAVELIQAFANRPNLAPQALAVLADLGERIERFELAEQLYRRLADQSAAAQNKLRWAEFLGRRNRVKEALDICEPLWKDTREVELVANACNYILFGANDHSRTLQPAQINRVAGWFEEAIVQARNQQRPNPGLLTGLGNLREKQGDYSEAQKRYLRATEEGDRSGISYNNLAWLAVLKDRKVKEALNYANRAIALKPDQPGFLDTRGVIYLAAGQPQRALDDLQRAVAIGPLSTPTLFHLSRAFLANNDKEKARQSLKTAEANGFTPSSLDALDQPSYQSFLNELGSP